MFITAPGKVSAPLAKQRFARRDGFTLMELMVVIFIMAVLSAILLPTLNKGRSRSQAISCLNNLRQLQLSWQMYTDDNSGWLPINNYVDGVKVGNFGPIMGPSWCPGDPRNDFDTDNIKRGELFEYANSPTIYHCPSDQSKVSGMTGDQQLLRTRSYSMSSSINSDITASFMPTFRKISEMTKPHPSGVFVFLDVNENCISDGHFAVYPKGSPGDKTVWMNMPSDRHGQAGNLSFADGHLERWLWNTKKEFKEWKQDVAGDGDRKDLERLQAASRPLH